MTSLDEFAQAVVERAQRKLGASQNIRGKQRRKDSTGTLRKSLTYKIQYGARKVNVQFGASGQAKKYASVVEEGRRKGKMPPISAIEKWIKDKPIRMRGPKGGFVKTTPQNVRQAAFAISRSIGARGIEPFPYFSESVEEELDLRGDAFADIIQDEIKIMIEKFNKK